LYEASKWLVYFILALYMVWNVRYAISSLCYYVQPTMSESTLSFNPSNQVPIGQVYPVEMTRNKEGIVMQSHSTSLITDVTRKHVITQGKWYKKINRQANIQRTTETRLN